MRRLKPTSLKRAWFAPHIGCVRSFSNKGGTQDNLSIAFAAACLPHPAKVVTGGEDSFFACTKSRSFGVADGVGGWAESGVDSGIFSRHLMQRAHAAITRDHMGDLHDVYREAANSVAVEQIQGGSTALIGTLRGLTLTVLNLGDSGVLVLRPALRAKTNGRWPHLFPRVIFRSCEQTHYFNCPYQLGGTTVAELEEPDIVGVRVVPGDLVIAATDGVFDNLFDRQLQHLTAVHLQSFWAGGEKEGEVDLMPLLQELAERIVQRAQAIGREEDREDVITPFCVAAQSEGLSFRGGKLDDTTVVVGLVVPDGYDTRVDQSDTICNWPHDDIIV